MRLEAIGIKGRLQELSCQRSWCVLDWELGLGLVVTALLVQVFWFWNLHQASLYGDMIHYNHSAHILLRYHYYTYWGYSPSAYVTPGYPLFLAGAYGLADWLGKVGSAAILTALHLQGALYALSTGLVYGLGRRILAPLSSLVAAGLWLSYPPAILTPQRLLTETLYTTCLLLYILLLTRALHHGRRKDWLIAGLVLGVTGLVRPTVFPLAAASLILWLWQHIIDVKAWRHHSHPLIPRRVNLGDVLTYIGGFVLVLSPWWLRNWLTLHRLLLTDDDFANPFLYGTDPNFQHDPALGNTAHPQTLALQRIAAGFGQHFWSTLNWYTAGKLKYLFGNPWYAGAVRQGSAWDIWLHFHLVWVFVGAVGLTAGLLVTGFRTVSLIAVFLVIVQLPFVPMTRYAFPIMPLFFLGIGLCVQLTMNWVEGREGG